MSLVWATQEEPVLNKTNQTKTNALEHHSTLKNKVPFQLEIIMFSDINQPQKDTEAEELKCLSVCICVCVCERERNCTVQGYSLWVLGIKLRSSSLAANPFAS